MAGPQCERAVAAYDDRLLRKYEAPNALQPSPQPSPMPEVAWARGRLLSIVLDERSSWALPRGTPPCGPCGPNVVAMEIDRLIWGRHQDAHGRWQQTGRREADQASRPTVVILVA